MTEIVVVNSPAEPPAEWDATAFLAGPTPRARHVSAGSARPDQAELTEAEIARTRGDPGPHAVAGDGERTDVEITTYGEPPRSARVDRSTRGMLAAVPGTADGQR
jgi:hypothetical protein